MTTDSTSTPGPQVPASDIPSELTNQNRWVVYKIEVREGQARPTKVPYCAPAIKASTTDPTTWLGYADALALARQKGFAGIGFVCSPEDDLMGIDLDNCRDANSGDIDDWARRIIDRFGTYTEISPSGTGVHLWLRARKPGERCKRGGLGPTGAGKIEVYDAGRYFTVTGTQLDGTPPTIEERQLALDVFYAETFPSISSASGSSVPVHTPPERKSEHLEDARVIAGAMAARNGAKFQRLYLDGDYVAYESQSEADLALCGMLAFWTQDETQIDRLFRQSPLMRPKWDERHGDATYGEMTIRKALAKRLDARRGDFEDSAELSPVEWDPVIELGFGDLPVFPTGALANWQRDFVEALAESTQTPVDLAALLTLGVTAASVHGKCEVHVRRDYWEPLNLFVATVAEPGERKTAVYAAVTRPLTQWEAEQREARKEDVAEACANRRLLEKRLERAQQEAANAKSESDRRAADEMRKLARELAQTPKPVDLAIWTDDTTAEALATLLSDHEGRMAVFAPEGGGLFAIMDGRYSNGPNFDVYLKGHAGEPLRVDRRNGASFDVPKATLTLAVTMQRAVLRSFGEKSADLRGRGLLARFLYSLPCSTLGKRNPNPTPLPQYVEDAYATGVRDLLALRVLGGIAAPQGPHVLDLSPEHGNPGFRLSAD